MPLSRYKFGDFKSPLQEVIGDRLVTISPGGVKRRSMHKAQTVSNALTHTKIVESYTQLRDAVQSVNPNSTIQWDDIGEVQFSQQAACSEAARTYAKWLTYADEIPTFELSDEDFDFWTHPIWGRKDRKNRYPHLTNHGCYYGYYLPCDFDVMIEIEMGRPIPSVLLKRSVGSSFRLRDELKEVGQVLGLFWDDDQGLGHPDRGFEIVDINDMDDRDIEPLTFVIDSLQQLSLAAAKSCKHGLPIIFCG